jgi:hypothetical protein
LGPWLAVNPAINTDDIAGFAHPANGGSDM